jgi:hypothetical protein
MLIYYYYYYYYYYYLYPCSVFSILTYVILLFFSEHLGRIIVTYIQTGYRLKRRI